MIGRAFLATFRAIFADRAAVLLLFVSAILYSFLYPSAYSGEVAIRMPVVAVDMDHSPSSRALLQRLTSVQQAELVGQATSQADAARWLQERRASAIIVIPDNFERTILRGEQATVALYGNGAYLLRSSTALAGVGAALTSVARVSATEQAMAQGAPALPTLGMIPRPLFNTREGYGSTVFPGVAFVIVHQTLLMGLALLAATLRAREGALKFQPRSLVGIALAFGVIGWIDVAYFTGFVFWFQDYPRASASIVTLVVAGSAFVAATVAAALAFASLFRTRERAIQLWIATSLPMFFLSGLSWPSEATPAWLAMLARLLPTTPGIHLLVGVNQMGASVSNQIVELANLGALTVVYGSIAVCRLARR